jgi:hypothetical protein
VRPPGFRGGPSRQFDVNGHLRDDLALVGYAVIPTVLSDRNIADLARDIAHLDVAHAGKRRLLYFPWCTELADRVCADDRLQQILGHAARAIECTLFVKSAAKIWLVALHQDLSVPVAARVENPEWAGWSHRTDTSLRCWRNWLPSVCTSTIAMNATERCGGSSRIPQIRPTKSGGCPAQTRPSRRANGRRSSCWCDGDETSALACLVEVHKRCTASSAAIRLRACHANEPHLMTNTDADLVCGRATTNSVLDCR